MLSSRVTLLFAMLLLLFHASCFAKNSDELLLTKILDSSLGAAQGGDYNTIDALISSASESKNPKELYISLLDYYLGAGAGEVLESFIVKENEHILPLLLKKKNIPLSCQKKYNIICVESIEHRNQRIDRLISEIRSQP